MIGRLQGALPYVLFNNGDAITEMHFHAGETACEGLFFPPMSKSAQDTDDQATAAVLNGDAQCSRAW